jgi:hypothetical protein
MSNNESFYTPPTLPNGDRDRRKEIEAWKRERNRGTAPLDLTVIVVIDNLLDALDEARKERDDAREERDTMEKLNKQIHEELVLRGRFDRAARMREEINSRTP